MRFVPTQNVLAKMVMERVPSVEMIRFVSSGTEACLSVLRVMRAYTKREKVRVPVGAARDVRLHQARGGARPWSVVGAERTCRLCLTLMCWSGGWAVGWLVG